MENSDSSLYAATLNSGLIFSFENDKSILELLKSQELFKDLVGQAQYKQVQSLKNQLIAVSEINKAIEKQSIYISLVTDKNKKNIDFLYSTILNTEEINKQQLLKTLSANKVQIQQEEELTKITLADSSIFYLAIKGKLLLLSSAQYPLKAVINSTSNQQSKFADYIKLNSRLTKNSLAEVYINFNVLPDLIKVTMPGKPTGELTILNHQDSYASLVYNFSKEKILLTGLTSINDLNSYYQLFSTQEAQKVTITNILPENTANYTAFGIQNYIDWSKTLAQWFKFNKEEKTISKAKENSKVKYHIDLETLFPKYFKNELISFQLSTAEKLGAVNLTNGDKLNQLLLDLSTEYSTEIRLFKESDLLYNYFGEPFKKFSRPYYTIIDNYMVFANNASTLESFLNSYRSNRLLLTKNEYGNVVNQLPNASSISFFIHLKNSQDIFRKNIYTPYYSHIINKNGLKDYSSLTYQLSSDNGKFQTNILLSKEALTLSKDSLKTQNDALINKIE